VRMRCNACSRVADRSKVGSRSGRVHARVKDGLNHMVA
jgi:hypothetical protein